MRRGRAGEAFSEGFSQSNALSKAAPALAQTSLGCKVGFWYTRLMVELLPCRKTPAVNPAPGHVVPLGHILSLSSAMGEHFMLRVCAETLACPCTLRNLKRERDLWARLSGSRSGSTACCGVTAVSCSVSLHLSFFICNRGALILGVLWWLSQRQTVLTTVFIT